ncbi:MAG: hypothetical protein BWY59_01971 [Verrucomicrobia bacterium ADurb.Bin345]|nr:MAG: hypothetical protein BWY59_01971 [Verrucomicrobia bacterium ADurb.Bin345]
MKLAEFLVRRPQLMLGPPTVQEERQPVGHGVQQFQLFRREEGIADVARLFAIADFHEGGRVVVKLDFDANLPRGVLVFAGAEFPSLHADPRPADVREPACAGYHVGDRLEGDTDGFALGGEQFFHAVQAAEFPNALLQLVEPAVALFARDSKLLFLAVFPERLRQHHWQVLQELGARILGQVIHGSELQGLDRDALHAEARDHHDRGQRSTALKFPHDIQPLHAGHLLVHQQEVVVRGFVLGEAALAVGGDFHGESARGKMKAHQMGQLRLILHEQNANRAGGPLFGLHEPYRVADLWPNRSTCGGAQTGPGQLYHGLHRDSQPVLRARCEPVPRWFRESRRGRPWSSSGNARGTRDCRN